MEYKVIPLRMTDNVAAFRNKAISEAREEGVKFLFFIQEDVSIKNEEVFNDYIDLMASLNYPIAFYPYYKKHNRTFNKKHKPNVIIIINDDNTVAGIRSIVNAFVCIDLSKVNSDITFNENLSVYDWEEFAQKVSDDLGMPFKGFYFDIEKSYEYFNTELQIDQIPFTQQMVNADQAYLKKHDITLSFTNNLDIFLEYLHKQYNIKEK